MATIRAVQDLELEIQRVRAALETARAMERAAALEGQTQTAQVERGQVSSLSDWLETYGRPERTGMLSTFSPSRRVHAPTSHTASFRSGAVTMKPGPLTR